MKNKRECLKCGQKIPYTTKINGVKKSLWSRKLCLQCSPYRGNKCKSKICKNCGKDFPLSVKVNSQRIHLYNRVYCLECVPFNSRISGENKYDSLNKPTPRKCRICDRTFIYDKKKGHRRLVCNSCKTIGYQISKKQRAIKCKGGKCVKCGYKKYYGALDFHHTDPSKKEFNICGNWNLSWKKLKNELDKCVLMCSNCHRELHINMREYTYMETMKNGRSYKRDKWS